MTIFYLGLMAIVLIYAKYFSARTPPSLKGREDLSAREIQERYYPNSNIVPEEFEELWNDIAESFLVPAPKVRPDDRFGIELPFTEVVSDEDMFLAAALYRRMKERGLEEPIPPLERVDDYIQFLCKSQE